MRSRVHVPVVRAHAGPPAMKLSLTSRCPAPPCVLDALRGPASTVLVANGWPSGRSSTAVPHDVGRILNAQILADR